ncbi:MAG: hypothetical protein EA381_14735 [Planctomycetaceae bacterium]|nr:MAG: hypothetical protein EA381_14735 [Planctomycetaceae bacterium]
MSSAGGGRRCALPRGSHVNPDRPFAFRSGCCFRYRFAPSPSDIALGQRANAVFGAKREWVRPPQPKFVARGDEKFWHPTRADGKICGRGALKSAPTWPRFCGSVQLGWIARRRDGFPFSLSGLIGDIVSIDRQPTPKTFIIIGVVACLPLAALISVCGVVSWGIVTGRVADTKVLAGNKLPPRVASTVAASAGLAPGERILFFYSAAMTPEGDGNLLTDRRVISYVDDGTGGWCESIAIDDIVSVHFVKSESWLDDSTIIVTSSDGFELTLYASTEAGGDVRFVEAIRSAAKVDGG